MITDLSQLDPNGSYTYTDYMTWKFSEFVELVKGHLVKIAAPRTSHQRILFQLNGMLYNHFRKHSHLLCKAYPAPFDVRLPKNPAGRTDREIYTVVQPDLCVICDATKVDERGCIGAPDWTIEITSPGSFNHDRFTKKDLYESHGVGEYWIVYPNEKMIEIYRADEAGTYGMPLIVSKDEGDTIAPLLFPELEMPLEEMFA